MESLTKAANTSAFSSFQTGKGSTGMAIMFIVILAILVIMQITKHSLVTIIHNFGRIAAKIFGKIINKHEKAYHRDLEIGKINNKQKRYKFYRFLNDLIIDLGYSRTGVTPYELFAIVTIISCLVTAVAANLIFKNANVLVVIFMCGIATVCVFCVMYTKANIAHDARIEAVIEAENIICNNIRVGVTVAVRESIDVMPKQVKPDFHDFLDNVEQKNYHIKTALLELNLKLGGIADDFIKKCIVFETEEEHGIAGMFQDIVEINNIKMEMRTEMKRQFEDVKTQFIIGASMIFIFLAGVLALYPDVRTWYFTTGLGQLIMALDFLLLVVEFVYITKLRAQEL